MMKLTASLEVAEVKQLAGPGEEILGGDALQKPRRSSLAGTSRTRMRMRTRRTKRRKRRQVSCPPRSHSDAD